MLAGGPTKTRNVSTVALRTRKHTYIVDAGEGASRQTFCGGIPGESISNIFITHLHGDHCFGLAGLLLYISDARSRDLKDKVLVSPGIVAYCICQMTIIDIMVFPYISRLHIHLGTETQASIAVSIEVWSNREMHPPSLMRRLGGSR